MEREQSRKIFNVKEASWNFDLSDIKNDKTQYLDKTPMIRSAQNSPFEPKEISARSTHIQSKFGQLDFDEIMKTSSSEAVRNKYRESLAIGRLSNFPKNDKSINARTTSAKQDFWDEANPSSSSFSGKNFTCTSEEFTPAEDMASQLDEDERIQEMEYAPIPHSNRILSEMTMNWDSAAPRRPEMSFGQYFKDKVASSDIREIYNAASPPKRHDRVPFIEMHGNDSSLLPNDSISFKNVEKVLKKSNASLLLKNNFQKKINGNPEFPDKDNTGYSSIAAKMMYELNVDRMLELTEKERNRSTANKENEATGHDSIPVHDENIDELQRCRNELLIPSRGVKRRTSAVSNETPKSALDKCLRSRSPSNQKELELAAARLKPKIMNDDDVFKKPLPCDSTYLKSCLKSPSATFTESHADSHGREYVTAMQSLSLKSQDEKLSLPNYSLQRPEKSAMTSPTSSIRSANSQWSPEFVLRRSASQMSNDSEFSDDFLPIKIKNLDNRKVSFPSVKIDKHVSKNISIQNGSDKKLPLRVKVIGSGFSVTPQEEFRMVPMEARTFSVKFSPSVIGPARGCLIFELITNKQCTKSIPLYAYGGHGNVSIENIQKGPFGPAFITMGILRDLTASIEHRIQLVNKGTLPSFVRLVFERTKLSDFVLSDSITMEPTQLRIEPGRSADVRIKFKATKSEIRKIISFNKDVTTIGEICVISGDEPTRLRILKNQHVVEPKLLDYLPKSLPNEAEIQFKLQKFKEDLSRDKLATIMKGIRTHEIALTINRNLEDSIFLTNEMSLADDTHISFESFVDQTNMPIAMDTAQTFEDDSDGEPEFLESKYFRITPSELTFYRSTDSPKSTKSIRIISRSRELLYIEAVPSNHKLISAIRPCGKLNPFDSCEIRVSATQKALDNPHSLNAFVVLVIREARVEIPVKIVD